MMNF